MANVNVNSQKTSVILAGQSFFFLSGNLFTLIVGFSFQVYLARELGAINLGIFGLLDAGVQMITGVLGFGTASTAVKYIPHYLETNQNASVKRLINRGITILLISGVFGYAALLLLFPFFSSIAPNTEKAIKLIPLMGSMIPLGLLLFFSMQVLRGFQDIRYIVIGSSFLKLTVKILLTIPLLSFGFGLMGYVLSVVLSSLAALVWMFMGILKHYRCLSDHDLDENSEANEAEWKKYAAIMYKGSLLGVVSTPLDRFLLGTFLGTSYVGILMVAKTLQQLPAIFLQMFLAVITPMFSAAYARNDVAEREHLFHLCTDWLVRISMPLIIFLFIYADSTLSLFGEEFATKGKYTMLILLAGQSINILSGPIGNVLNMSGQEGVMLKISLISKALTVLSLITFIPLFGLEGAALGLTLGSVVSNAVALAAAKRSIGLTWWSRRYIKWFAPVMVCFLLNIGIVYTFQINGYFYLIIALISTYVIFSALSLLSGVSEEDKEVVFAILDKVNSFRKGRIVQE